MGEKHNFTRRMAHKVVGTGGKMQPKRGGGQGGDDENAGKSVVSANVQFREGLKFVVPVTN